MSKGSIRFKGTRTFLSDKYSKGLFVAEAKQAVVSTPVMPEVAKTELPVTVRVAAHVRHPMAAVSVFPEVFLFIK